MHNKERIDYLISILKKQSNDCDEEDIFDNLLELRINNVSNCLNKNDNYNKNAIKIYSIYEKLENMIKNKEVLELLDEWMCLINENNEYGNELFYKLGAKDQLKKYAEIFRIPLVDITSIGSLDYSLKIHKNDDQIGNRFDKYV